MANAGINITGDGTINDITSPNGRTQDVSVFRLSAGVYELHGTQGLVPPPYGWGYASNPVDRITVAISVVDDIIHVETRDDAGALVDIPSMLTLHIVVADRETSRDDTPVPQPKPDAATHYLQLRAVTDERILSMEDLIDIGEAAPELELQVLDWKRYRVALNELPKQPGWPVNVAWPKSPVD
ncbi:phage tail assembly chaperone [Pseudomonas alliivorans]|nr:phage tail assembly chaperone [Pseudomonas alliivorans]MEE5171588.1 phage tail assembly chaperone [Pseudomonas alliivorans]